MRKWFCLLVLMFLSNASPALQAAGGPAEPKELPGTIWETFIKSDVFEYEYQTSALASDDSAWLVISARAKGQLSGPKTFLLFNVSNNGRILAELQIDSLLRQAGENVRLATICCLTVLKSENLVLLGTSEGLDTFFINLGGKAGKPTVVKQVSRSKDDRSFNRVLNMGNQRLLAIGRSGREGSIVTLDLGGNVLAEKLYGTEGVTVFLDGVKAENGLFTLIGTSQTGDAWIGSLSSSGEVLYKTHFPGRSGRITGSGSTGYRALLEEQTPSGLDVWVKGLTPDLKESWKSKVLPGAGPLDFRIALLADNDVIIAGSKHNLLSVARVDSDGRLKWTYTQPYDQKTQPFLRNIDVLTSRDGLFVMRTILALSGTGTTMEQRQSVGIIKLSAK